MICASARASTKLIRTSVAEPIPDRLKISGRSADPHFEPQENLYYRFDIIMYQGFRAGSGISFRLPNFSVNREKYSEPDDVLLPSYKDYGYLSFKKSHFPPPAKSAGEEGKWYCFDVMHNPVEDNYSHTDVRCLKDGFFSDNLGVPKTVKKVFRQTIAEKCKILRKPAGAD